MAELGAARRAHVFAAAKLGLLWGKLIAVHWRFYGAANSFYEPEAAQTGTFIKQIFGREFAQPKIFPASNRS